MILMHFRKFKMRKAKRRNPRMKYKIKGIRIFGNLYVGSTCKKEDQKNPKRRKK